MKKGRTIYAFVFALIVFFGCQPTPEHDVIVNRSENAAEKKILYPNTAEEVAPLSCPPQWNETLYLNNGMSVRIESSVETGKGDCYPVYTIKRRTLDSEYVVQIVNAVFDDVKDMREQSISYEELLEDYLSAQRGVFDGFDEKGNAIWAPYDGQEKEVARIKGQLEDSGFEPTFSAFNASSIIINNEWRQYAVRRSNNSIMYLNCTSLGGGIIWCHTSRNCNIQRENWVMQGDAIPGEKPHLLEKVHITQKDAESLAEEIFARLEIKNLQLSYSQKARSVNDWDVTSEGWLLEYAPATDGTCGCSLRNYTSNGIIRADQGTYSMPWAPESVEIYVTENGVESFSLMNPYQITNTANENVQLLPFEEIQERIRNAFRFGLAWIEGNYIDSKEVIISRMVLTTGIMQITNQSEEAFLVPIWAVFYTTDLERELHFDQSVLLINALDGSIIVQ